MEYFPDINGAEREFYREKLILLEGIIEEFLELTETPGKGEAVCAF